VAAPRNIRSGKLVIPRRLPKGRVPLRPTKVETPKTRYDRRRGKQEADRVVRDEGGTEGE
jgi:hypothetical protein